MKRFHVHVRVKDLSQSKTFYSSLFKAEPAVLKPDYAKWMLEDPRLNFAISTGHAQTGIEHLGLEAESREELELIYEQMQQAEGSIRIEGECTCCYSKSQKSWITDPQGVDWEAFYTYDKATVYGEGKWVRPAPGVMKNWTENNLETVTKIDRD